jgi:hypothetical protein
MLVEVKGLTDGSASFALRWAPARPCIVQVIEAVNDTALTFVSIGTGVRGASLESMIGLKQASTGAAGLGVQWTGRLDLAADDEIEAIFLNCPASEVVSLTAVVHYKGAHRV